MKYKSLAYIFTALSLLLSLLASCGGEQKNDKASGSGAEEVVFVMNNAAEPKSLDPHKVSGVPEHRIYEAFFQGLVTYNPKTAHAVPGAAESWSNEGPVYTMKLRKDLVWSDGVPITAETVRDSWLRGLNPETASPYAWFPAMFIKGAEAYNKGEAGIESVAIEAVDPHTFRFETVGELPYVVDALAHYAFGIVPLHAIEKYGNDWTKPENIVGNGPFVLTEWSPQEIIVGEKNDKFWNKDHVYIDRIEILPIEDANTAFNMYENGEMDWNTGVPTEQFDSLRGRDDFYVSSQLATYYYIFNNSRPPFDDMRVRKALAMTMGREDIANKVMGQGQVPAYAMVPPIDGYDGIAKTPEDVEMAKALLAEAGYPDGEGFPTITILYNTSEGHKKVAEFVQQRWDEVLGIKVELENQEWKTFLQSRTDHNFDIARGGWVGDYLDPNTFLDMFVSGGGVNNADYR
ncbi:MAG: peptide ABC transporter substrate-binding protein, partial [Spirochaetota bacterium]